jgi:N-methylhydantoinase A
VDEHVAKKLSLSVEDAAEGIVRIIDVKMQEAIKAISTMRGTISRISSCSPSAARGHCTRRGSRKSLGMAGVVVPLYPGVYSAMGLLMSDVKHDYIRSKLSPLAKVNGADVAKVFDELQAHAMRDLKAENFRDDQVAIERALDMRYAGQGYEITIACDDGLDLAGTAPEIRR